MGKSPIEKIEIEPGDWAAFRRQMPVAARWAYFDHAAVAPLPQVATDTLARWGRQAGEHGDVYWPRWADGVEQTRHWAARIIGAEPAEIALVPNTTSAIGLVAEGIRWQPGDNVVFPTGEFPSNAYPWLNLESRGVEPRMVPMPPGRVDIDRLIDSCDERTRLLAVSWIGYAHGWRIDLRELVRAAHDRGVMVMLDAIQGLGVFALDVRDTPVDFLAADGHKWMLGPEGAGLLYVRQQNLGRLRPLGVGWHSVVNEHDFAQLEFDLKPNASRYEGGTANTPGLLALGASLQLLLQLGLASSTSTLERRVLELSDMAVEQLQCAGAQVVGDRSCPDRQSGIVVFQVPGVESPQVRQACLLAEVVVSCRGAGVRISPHAYNDASDIERLVDVVRRLVR